MGDFWNVIHHLGVGFEIAGLALTAFGLLVTWLRHPHEGRSLIKWPRAIWSRLRPQPPPPPVRTTFQGAIGESVEMALRGNVWSDGDADQQIGELRRELSRLGGEVRRISDQVLVANRELHEQLTGLGARLGEVRAETSQQVSKSALDGVPAAFWGVVLLALGLLMQLPSAD